MRFTRKYQDGDYRVVKFFAWLPVELLYETRWLETVYILQGFDFYLNDWINVKWSDEDHYRLYIHKIPEFNDA